MVLVDAGVWIDHLRGGTAPPVALLRRLLQEGDAAIAPVILQEVLQGAANEMSFERLRRHFTELPLLEARPDGQTHVAAAALYARCRWQGYTPRSPNDCLIAQIAMEHDVRLLHDDRDFEALARVEPKLRVISR